MRKLVTFTLLVFSLFFISNKTLAQEPSNCLAKAIYFESRGGSTKDMLDVGHVVLNRANDQRFPKDVCSVVFQKSKNICQFSWACNPVRITDLEEFNKSKEFASKLLEEESEGKRLDTTRGALFFHNFTINPKWKRKQCHINKQHVFYK